MERIIAWLIGIEEWASRLYGACARAVAEENPAAARMLSRLCDDEAQHALYLERALDCCIHSEALADAIRLDRTTVNRAEAPFKRLEAALEEGPPAVTVVQVLEGVVLTERSEWNALFLYVVDTLKKRCPEMAHVAPQIQHHLRYIENSLAAIAPGSDWHARIGSLPPVWQEKILVVEDDKPIAALLETILSRDGVVQAAAHGEAALEKIRRHYFAVIISDIDMPIMDGWMFYKRALRHFGRIGQRFIFITGDQNSPSAQKIRQEGLPILAKPFSLTEIHQKVYEMMECNTGGACASQG